MNEQLKQDLNELAKKHGLSYDGLINLVQDMANKRDTFADITTLLEEEYPEIALTEGNVNIICNRFLKSEDSEYGTWDNIRNAIDYVRDQLEEVK